jgi:hypothetical protein
MEVKMEVKNMDKEKVVESMADDLQVFFINVLNDPDFLSAYLAFTSLPKGKKFLDDLISSRCLKMSSEKKIRGFEYFQTISSFDDDEFTRFLRRLLRRAYCPSGGSCPGCPSVSVPNIDCQGFPFE